VPRAGKPRHTGQAPCHPDFIQTLPAPMTHFPQKLGWELASALDSPRLENSAVKQASYCPTTASAFPVSPRLSRYLMEHRLQEHSAFTGLQVEQGQMGTALGL
jgi:hypothetical protein